MVNRLPLRNRVTKPVVEIETRCSRDPRRVLYAVLCTLDRLGGSGECVRRARGRRQCREGRCGFNGVGADPSDERMPRAENSVMLDEFWLTMASNII